MAKKQLDVSVKHKQAVDRKFLTKEIRINVNELIINVPVPS